MANTKPEWSEFKVGNPSSNPRFTEPSCREFTTVSHVAHVDTALDIVRTGKIKASLISDKSKLNTDRILVVWASPNSWEAGYRYGNIEFVFDWRSLVEGKKYYWVESMAYGIKACRILVTDTDHSRELDKLQEYNPAIGDGPWWYDTANDRHYWNGTHCLEIMLERDLPLAELSMVNFVKHHSHQCCNTPGSCPDHGDTSRKGGARFLAGLAALELNTESLKLTQKEDGLLVPTDAILTAWDKLKLDLIRDELDYEGEIDHENKRQSDAISRAILSAYWRRNKTEQRSLNKLFVSEDAVLLSSERLISDMLGVEHLDKDDAE